MIMQKKKEDNKTKTKKKPGPKKGSPSNNPFGRPAGSKNKVSAAVKYRIAEYVNNDFDTYIKEIEEI